MSTNRARILTRDMIEMDLLESVDRMLSGLGESFCSEPCYLDPTARPTSVIKRVALRKAANCVGLNHNGLIQLSSRRSTTRG